jgi:nitrite reductase (NADH) small subunit
MVLLGVKFYADVRTDLVTVFHLAAHQEIIKKSPTVVISISSIYPKKIITMTTWKPICRVEDIPALGARRVARDNATAVAVFRTADDQVFALLDRCPHKGGPLSQGIVLGDSVACPMHNWTIGLDDGCARAPDEGCTPRFNIQVVDGVVQLDVDELNSLALGEFKLNEV